MSRPTCRTSVAQPMPRAASRSSRSRVKCRPGGRRRGRAERIGEDRLIALGVAEPAADVGRQRDGARGEQRGVGIDLDVPDAIVERRRHAHNQVGADRDDVAGAQAAGRASQRFPLAWPARAQQQKLGPATARKSAQDARGQDPRAIRHEQITRPQYVRADPRTWQVLQGSGRTAGGPAPASRAASRGSIGCLGDERLGQAVVEVRYPHRAGPTLLA